MPFRLRRSTAGFIAAGIYVLAFVAGLAWVFVAPTLNPGESGETGILLLPFLFPWLWLVSASALSFWVALGIVGLNAICVYFLFGGLRFKRRR